LLPFQAEFSFVELDPVFFDLRWRCRLLPFQAEFNFIELDPDSFDLQSKESGEYPNSRPEGGDAESSGIEHRQQARGAGGMNDRSGA